MPFVATITSATTATPATSVFLTNYGMLRFPKDKREYRRFNFLSNEPYRCCLSSSTSSAKKEKLYPTFLFSKARKHQQQKQQPTLSRIKDRTR